MSIGLNPRLQFVNNLGQPYAFASAYVYLTDTTTPATIYADATLITTQTNPMTADDEGRFPTFYIDGASEHRLVVVKQGGSLGSPLIDVDPIDSVLTVTAADLANGAIEGKLGYTPVDPSNGAFNAPVTLIYATEPTSLSPFDMGYLGAPTRIEDANYTLILSDAGKMLLHDDATGYTWTIPPNSSIPFPVGTVIYVANINSGAIILARGAGVAMRLAGSATNADFTLSQWGFGQLRKVATDSWLILGAGIA